MCVIVLARASDSGVVDIERVFRFAPASLFLCSCKFKLCGGLFNAVIFG
jgi:hypothetical protein